MAKKITNEFLEQFRAEMQAAVEAVAAKHGLAGKLGNCRYTDSSFRYAALEFAVIPDGTSEEAAAADFDPIFFNAMKRYGYRYNMSVADINKVINYGGKQMKILGLGKTGKFVVGEGPNGGKWKLDIDIVVRTLRA